MSQAEFSIGHSESECPILNLEFLRKSVDLDLLVAAVKPPGSNAIEVDVDALSGQCGCQYG